jgi:hypothetical protein
MRAGDQEQHTVMATPSKGSPSKEGSRKERANWRTASLRISAKLSEVQRTLEHTSLRAFLSSVLTNNATQLNLILGNTEEWEDGS